MLSAFTARSIVELKQRDKSKIESLLAYGDRLLVGLSTGTLRIYRVNESISDSGAVGSDEPQFSQSTKAVDLLREHERFAKGRLEQLAIIKEANILLSLSSGFVSIHDLQTCELQEVLVKTKGAITFAVTSNIVKDSVTGIPSIVSRLAVAVKRRLLLWSWHDSEFSPETTELTLVTGIKTLTWASGTRIIAGLSSSYVLVDVESSSITDIVGPGSIGGSLGQDVGRFGGVGAASMGYIGMGGMVPKPLATRLSEGQLLLAKDVNTLFIDSEGVSLGRRQIPWSVAPEAIGYSYPFLLALQATKGTLEVRNPETANALQTIPLPNASQLHVPNPNVSLAHAGKGFLVSSERCIWRMDALGYDDQIDALVEKRKMDEAISLLGMLEDALLKNKQGRLREIKMLKAEDLFDQRRYRESLDLFASVFTPPERVVALYPSVISGELAVSGTAGDTTDRKKDNKSSGPVDATKEASISKSANKTLPANDGLDDTKLSADTASIRKSDLVGASGSDTASVRSKVLPPTAQRTPLEGKDLQTATSELSGFLVGARTTLQRFLNQDGSLNEHSGGTNETQQGSQKMTLQELQAALEIDEHDPYRGERLLETAKLVDTTLFRAYMLERPSMAGPLFRRPNFCDADVVNKMLLDTGRYVDLIDYLFGKRLHRQALDLLKKFGQSEDDEKTPAQLRGSQRTIAYLQNLPPEMIDLILQYADWPVREDPDSAMEIFLADTEHAETLPRAQVLDFLQEIDRTLAEKYLNHIIHELNDTTAEFHQRLIEVYLRGLKSEDSSKDGIKDDWKNNFHNFLRTSEYYEPYQVLKKLSRDDPDLYEARAIVLGKMGEHRQALNIYVFNLNDGAKAEEYCNQIFLKTDQSTPSFPVQSRLSSTMDEGPPSIYHTLLSLYLSPPPPHEPQWGPALDIMAKHGSRLPASSTLNLIPEVLQVQKLESYFRARIRTATSMVNEGHIVAGLRKTIDIGEEAKLRLGDGPGGRNRSVLVTEEKVCGVCHKRFGGSAIKVLPNDTVVHYGCSAR